MEQLQAELAQRRGAERDLPPLRAAVEVLGSSVTALVLAAEQERVLGAEQLRADVAAARLATFEALQPQLAAAQAETRAEREVTANARAAHASLQYVVQTVQRGVVGAIASMHETAREYADASRAAGEGEGGGEGGGSGGGVGEVGTALGVSAAQLHRCRYILLQDSLLLLALRHQV